MRNFEFEINNRIEFIRSMLADAHANGIVFGNSGGKDSALVGILCKRACDNTVGLIMPCESKQNYGADKTDAESVAKRFDIAVRVIELSDVKSILSGVIGEKTQLTEAALTNMTPRLRMTTLYAVAASENRLVAGTGNRSEGYMGYFTKWGDGAFDFNPIADLTVTEIYDFLRYFSAPDCIINKAPSAGLYDGQTDESEMGVTYKSIDNFLLNGTTNEIDRIIIEKHNKASAHKRNMPPTFES